MARPAPRAERVLALLEGAATDAVLEAAAEMAAARRLPLVALVIEDVQLLASAGLPFAREIGPVSGASRPLSAAGVEARMQEHSERLRGQLEELARRHGIAAELDVRRGPRAQTVLARLHPADTLVLRRSHALERPFALFERVLAGARCTVLVSGEHGARRAARGMPMLLIEDEASGGRVVARAAALTRGRFPRVVLLLAPGLGQEALRRLVSRLAEEGLGVDTIELPRFGAAAVLQLVRRERPALLCLARDSAVLAGSEGGRLAESEDVPLAVVP